MGIGAQKLSQMLLWSLLLLWAINCPLCLTQESRVFCQNLPKVNKLICKLGSRVNSEFGFWWEDTESSKHGHLDHLTLFWYVTIKRGVGLESLVRHWNFLYGLYNLILTNSFKIPILQLSTMRTIQPRLDINTYLRLGSDLGLLADDSSCIFCQCVPIMPVLKQCL